VSQLQAVLFDLGDTLVDLGEGRGDYEARVRVRADRVWVALAAAGRAPTDREAFAAHLAHETEARYQAYTAQQRGVDIYTVMAEIFADDGIAVEPELLQACGDAYGRGDGPHASLRTGAREALDWLRAAGMRLGVISNTIQPGRNLDAGLARRGLLDYFTVRIYSSDAGFAKPHPALFRAALAALDTPAERAVYVGDRLVADIGGAQGAGMRGVLIVAPHRPEQHPTIRPDATIQELLELPAALERMAGALPNAR
jgi:putative hydrolase of the HAD superfamily